MGTTKYSYTLGNQLLTELSPFSSGGLTNTYVNRLRISLSLQQPTGTWTNRFVYDANGNCVTNFVYISYTYDAENRLSLISDVVYRSYQSGFVYDGLGRLRTRNEYTWNGSKWVVGSTVNYLYDGNRVIQERDGSNNPNVSYTRGLDLSGTMEGAGGIGGLLGRSSGYSAGNWTTNHYYHADGNGNIMYLVDSSQGMAATYRYDPFGNSFGSSGPLASANVYQFSSKELHRLSGMYYFLYRFYDPSVRRWLNRDPLGESGFERLRNGFASPSPSEQNRYLFVKNAPSPFLDTDGLGIIAIPLPGGLAIPIPEPILENPIGASLVGGAAAGAALCFAFPNVATKPGEWIGNLLVPKVRLKTCTYACFGGSAGEKGKVTTITVPVDHPCNARIPTSSGAICDKIGEGPINN